LNATEKAEYVKAEAWMKKYIAGVKDEYDWVMGTSKTLPKKMVEWDVDPSMFERAKAYLAENDLYPQYDTYAALQYKLKKKNEAIQNAEIAISIAKKFELDDSGTKTLLEDIKKLK
jgi:hypothetical protein